MRIEDIYARGQSYNNTNWVCLRKGILKTFPDPLEALQMILTMRLAVKYVAILLLHRSD